MESIWSKTAEIREHPALSGDLTADVAVIGGGLCGILTAYRLKEHGVKAVVLEADRIGSGQTRGTTAKITSQHGILYEKLIREFGTEAARQYADANGWAISEFFQISEKNSISCELERMPACVYSLSAEDLPLLSNEAEAARSLGIDAQLITKTELPFPVAGSVQFSGQAQFHPLRFLGALADELTVYEHTAVRHAEGHLLHTDRGDVSAEQVVFATHFPFVNLPGYYFARMHQSRSYLLALEHAPKLDGMYLGIGEEGFTFRSSGKYLLMGGGDHRTGENREGGKYDLLRRKAAEWFPGSTEAAHWSAQDCMPLDGVPYIGPFSPSAPGWFVATGFGKWGMTTSMVASRILADQILGKKNPWEEVFSPQRFTPAASVKALFTEGGQAIKGLSKELFAPPRAELDALPKGHGGIVECEGKKVGVYKDEVGEIFLVSTRCPHLGCQLEWNPDEKSWDCPCHGSRFDYRGHLIDNPAQCNLEGADHA